MNYSTVVTKDATVLKNTACILNKTGVATLKLNRKPVNSLNSEMLTQIVINAEKIQNDKSIKGAIITSVSRI